MSQAMQIYKTTNAFYLQFCVGAHTTQTADDISCVAHIHPIRPASLVLRSLVFLFGFIWFCLEYILCCYAYIFVFP
jgi:hypothetical protein